MQFDDRLATVLRTRAQSDAVLRTQFRQLLDLLGTASAGGDPGLRSEAFARLEALAKILPQEDQSRILREPGLRLRNPALVGFLAAGEAKPAAAAMATARLGEGEWLELIPQLPVTARGFLRHRRNLSPRVKDLLVQLGVGDLVLPEPDDARVARIAAAVARPAPGSPGSPISPLSANAEQGIGTLLRRIEAFREQRRNRPVAPRLPLGEQAETHTLTAIEFACDAEGIVTWANEEVAPLLVGMHLTAPRPGTLVARSERMDASLAAHQPIHAAPLTIDAAPDVSGEWRLDAAPLFDPQRGSFTGYRGCLRRPAEVEIAAIADSEADRMRQILHELRTPVNAIQGFAEIIQQQLFGQAPHQYRAHAAAIAVDAAKLLAGFDEVDRLVKLEGQAMTLEPGTTDLRAAIEETVERLQPVLRSRNAEFSLKIKGEREFTVALDRSEALVLCWRLLATAAGALAPGDRVRLVLDTDGSLIRLKVKAPRPLFAQAQAQIGEVRRQRAVNAGMFGPVFAFRLAQAEARAAGGQLNCKINRVTLVVPALTATSGESSAGMGRIGG